MKTIIVPVDFSTPSENALKVAAQLAKKHKAEVVAVHMMGMSDTKLTKDDNSLEGLFLVKLTKQKFEAFLDKPYLKDVVVHQTVKNYKVFSELDEVAKNYNADVIIMGSHGSSGIQEVFVGSNTEKVVRTASVPVIVIKGEPQFNPKKAVFACDFRLESLEVFEKAVALFKALNTTIKFVYINTPGENFNSNIEIEKQIVDFIVRLKGDYKILPEDIAIYADYSVEKGVFNFAKKMKADVIAIPTHGRRGLSHFFSGSIGEDVVNHSEIPVITFKI